MAVTIDQKQIDDLVARPSESLNVEIKRWISTDEPEGIAKIARAALALRNKNGGFLIVGFDDKTLQPDIAGVPADIHSAFHVDKIQAIVSRYSFELFEVAVGFGQRGGTDYPVITIPEGLRFPVAAKADLKDAAGKLLVRAGEVYCRTLGSNGIVSTAPARPADWRDIVDICFENREADIGRFLRRLVGDGDVAGLLTRLSGIASAPPDPTLQERTKAFLDAGQRRYSEALGRRGLTAEQLHELDTGTWSVALVVDPSRPEAAADKQFLYSFGSANPNYTGWPVWLDTRGFTDATSHPVHVDKGWEALVISPRGWSQHVDFMRMEPQGAFYLHRLLQDDFTDKVPRGSALDAILALLRTAEAIAVGLSLVKNLGWPVEETKLGFCFRWTKLGGRELSSWANPLVSVLPGHTAVDDTAECYIEMPLDTPASAIAPYVDKVINDLLIKFDGYQIRSETIEGWVKRLVERQL